MKRIGCIPFLIAIFLILPGIGLLCGAKLYNTIWETEKEQCTETTTAVVSEIVEDMDDNGDDRIYTYHALAEYSVNNNNYSVKDSMGYGRESIPYSVGDEVTVHYNPNNPKKMYINEKEMSKVPTVFKIVGSVLIGFALLILVLSACLNRKNYTENSQNHLTI